ncbi:MAG: hypothetical protein ACK2T3_07000 [Candidatus Promineifilaceae bacterium]
MKQIQGDGSQQTVGELLGEPPLYAAALHEYDIDRETVCHVGHSRC